MLRCFRELAPTPSAQEIASLLGFENVNFISFFTQKIQTKSVIVLFYQEPAELTKRYSVFDTQQMDSLSNATSCRNCCILVIASLIDF